MIIGVFSMPNSYARAAIFILYTCAPPLSAAVRYIECPPKIPEASIRLENPPAGWTVFAASPLYLHAAAPINGPPEQLGQLREYSERRGKTEWSYTYRLDGPFPDGKWMQCAYGAFNELTLSTRLDEHTSECTVTYREGKKVAQHDLEITCK